MKTSSVLPMLVALGLSASAAYGRGTQPKGASDRGADASCCENPVKAAKGYKATGVVKNIDAARGTATIAHGPVTDLNWPAMTMAFKVKDKGLLDKLAVDKKVDFTLMQEGKDYVITAVQ